MLWISLLFLFGHGLYTIRGIYTVEYGFSAPFGVSTLLSADFGSCGFRVTRHLYQFLRDAPYCTATNVSTANLTHRLPCNLMVPTHCPTRPHPLLRFLLTEAPFVSTSPNTTHLRLILNPLPHGISPISSGAPLQGHRRSKKVPAC